MALNFNNINKKKFTVTLNDSNNTTLILLNPTKRIMENLIEIHKSSESSSNEIDPIDDIYYVCSEILSRNLNKVKISKEMVEDIFDIEDINILLEEYFKFVNNQIIEKN